MSRPAQPDAPCRVVSWRRRILAGVAVLGLVALAGWVGLDHWARAELARARREVERREFGRARERLDRIAAFGPVRVEAVYLIGVCDLGNGNIPGALAAWARVPIGSGLGPPVALERARAAIASGRLGLAEEALGPLLRRPDRFGSEARREWERVLRLEVRIVELRDLLQRHWKGAADPAAALRDLWMLDLEPVPTEAVRAHLEASARAQPGEDRVSLGLANLAIRAGDLDEADARLAACLMVRPADPAVWLARLDWARAARRPAEARSAIEHLGRRAFPASEVHALRAWFAACRGDREAERRALEDLVRIEPGHASALDRLADLAIQGGRPAIGAEYRRRKARADADRERYRELVAGPRPSESAAELSTLAERLGRRFEARGWATIRLRRGPGDQAARALLARLGAAESNRPSLEPADLRSVPSPIEGHSSPDLGLPAFEDQAAASGLRFTYQSGRSELRQLPETMGGGVALLDADGDGWLDVYCVQGGPFPPSNDGDGPGDRLFRNRGDGTFEDVTRKAGLGPARGYGQGVAVGDVDNDGHPDLFVTRWRSYALYRNQGAGTFEDVTERSGLGGDRDWPTSAAFADLDGDGDLDLYVCHYLKWDAEHPKTCRHPYRSGFTACEPRGLEASPDHLFRNDGGRFVDVTAEAGIDDRDGRGLGVVAADLDGDGRVDLYVANDTTANFFFRNQGGLRFEEQAHAAGLAGNAEGGYQAGMGVAAGDLDGDGRLDLAVTNYFGESTTFYANLGAGQFADRTAAVGLAAPSRYLLGFGIAMADLNDDGRPDLVTANGHVDDLRPIYPYPMPAQLLLGLGGGRLRDVTARLGPSWRRPRVGRGLAVGDLDNDGRLDVLIVAQDAPLAYLRNRTSANHALTIALEGSASGRDAIGAVVVVEAGGRSQSAARLGGGSYLSASDPRIHVGLGAADRADAVEVRWPSGRIDRHRDLAADACYTLREGEARPGRGPGPPTRSGTVQAPTRVRGPR